MQQQKQTAERVEMVHEAIALHTSAGIADSREPEIALTHLGTGFDVLGVHNEDVALTTKRAIIERWPRADFKDQFAHLIDAEVLRKPDCHMAPMHKFGFVMMMKHAPFPE